jgi:DNA-directed RNA polymerase specialized sigma24 family protein
MPAETRELLYLRYANDLSYQAIAELLGTTPEAVHGRLVHAKQQVREYLERQEDRRPS